MRLVCPNCEAKYEVPEDAIPETGRDVQCANCGHAWYQMRPRSEAPAAAPAVAPTPAAVETPTEPVLPSEAAAVEAAAVDMATDPTTSAASAPPAAEPPVTESAGAVQEAAVEQSLAPVTDEAPDTASVARSVIAEAGADGEARGDADLAATADVPLTSAVGTIPAVEAAVAEAAIEEELAEAPSPDDAAAPVAAAPVAYAVDESVLAILREEAEREAEVRRAEAARPLETQVDLGIETVMPAPKPPEPEPMVADATRRTRLPDVEEINSTLRPADTHVEAEPAAEMQAPAESRSSFRSGFLLVLTVAILGSALYGSADALAEAVPALAGPLKAYVGFVDSLRLQLDGLMQSATVAIGGN